MENNITAIQAIGCLKKHKEERKHDFIVIMGAVDKAIEALEKQIPKKPLDICMPVVKWGLCPICKGQLRKLAGKPNRVFETDKYCPDCGQALDWSDE